VRRIFDRRAGRSPFRGDGVGPDPRLGRELGWIVTAAVGIAVALVVTHAFEPFIDGAGTRSGGDQNGLLAILVVAPIAALAFAISRSRDARADRVMLHRLSFHDGLTGLPNRSFLGQGFDQMLEQSRRGSGRIAVLFVDLAGFPEINATFGPVVGDQVMVAMAARLVGVGRPDDRVVRYGGDQFVLFCPNVPTAISAERTAREVLESIELPFMVGNTPAHLSASVGIALTEERCTRPDEVLADADSALARAREHGPGSYATFDRAMRDRITPASAERRLRAALAAGEFRLYYQPIVSLWTQRLVGVEAQLRWNDPERGMVHPDEFMPALEQTGLMVPIGAWILEEVARQSRAWQDAFPDRSAINITVNVTARQLTQVGFVGHLTETLARFGTDPTRLYLEISESVLRADPEVMGSILAEAQSHGVALALDDFGTGFSSLNYLRHLKLDMLTIDRSFIGGLGQSGKDDVIVAHVIGMAKALGIVTVGEGVDDPRQVEKLRELTCDLAEGPYFSEPQPPYVITELLGLATNEGEWSPPERTDGTDGTDHGADADGLAPIVMVDNRFNSVRA
jgi:diguanylate cyclase (GGDEF)-like protein